MTVNTAETSVHADGVDLHLVLLQKSEAKEKRFHQVLGLSTLWGGQLDAILLFDVYHH
jgi:hypothetical protein